MCVLAWGAKFSTKFGVFDDDVLLRIHSNYIGRFYSDQIHIICNIVMARQKSAVVQHAYLFIADSNCEELEL